MMGLSRIQSEYLKSEGPNLSEYTHLMYKMQENIQRG